MSYATGRLNGLEELQRLFTRLPAQLEAELSLIALEELMELKQDVLDNIPVKTGRLKKTVRLEVYDHKLGGLVKVGRTKTAPYAHLVEYGFKHHKSGKHTPGRPFVTPAAERARARFLQRAKEAVRRAMP